MPVLKTLKSRVLLVLVASLALSHIAGLWLYARKHEEAASLLQDTLLADRIEVLDGQGTRRAFNWTNHLMTGHAVPGGLQTGYAYDRADPGGKVVRHWNNVGQEWLFDYDVNATRVTTGSGTPEERTEIYHFDEGRLSVRYFVKQA